MSDLTFMPSNSLTTPSASIARPNKFILFCDSWMHLQTYISACQRLPIHQGSFVQKYGSFSDKDLITGAYTAMGKVQGLTAEFGNPSILKDRIRTDSSYLLGAQPPSEIYGHIVWLAIQIQNTADTFQNTFSSLSDVIGPQAGTQAQRAQNMRDLLTGAGGLVSSAIDMKTKTAALLSKLATFDGKITAANTELMAYTSQQSDILKAANRMIGEYSDKIENELKPASHQAWEAWRNYTIAAVSASVGLFLAGALVMVVVPGPGVLVGGGLMAAGAVAAGVLTTAAGRQRQIYNNLLDQIDQTEKEKQKKVHLVSDLTALNSQVVQVSGSISEFQTNLSIIEGVWTDIGGRLAYIANNTTPKKLSNYAFVNQNMRILDAQTKWKAIAVTTQEFTQNSLVDYQHGHFGDPLPVAA